MESEAFEKAHQGALSAAEVILQAQLKGDSRQAYVQRFQQSVTAYYDQQKTANISKSEKMCQELMERITQTIEYLIAMPYAVSPDPSPVSVKVDQEGVSTLEDLQRLWDLHLSSTYDAQARGPCKDAVQARFLRSQMLSTARRTVGQMIAAQAKEHEKELAAQRAAADKQTQRVEELYKSVQDSWERSKRQNADLQEENSQLIKNIAHLSEVIN